jgi:hypothetical protein
LSYRKASAAAANNVTASYLSKLAVATTYGCRLVNLLGIIHKDLNSISTHKEAEVETKMSESETRPLDDQPVMAYEGAESSYPQPDPIPTTEEVDNAPVASTADAVIDTGSDCFPDVHDHLTGLQGGNDVLDAKVEIPDNENTHEIEKTATGKENEGMTSTTTPDRESIDRFTDRVIELENRLNSVVDMFEKNRYALAQTLDSLKEALENTVSGQNRLVSTTLEAIHCTPAEDTIKSITTSVSRGFSAIASVMDDYFRTVRIAQDKHEAKCRILMEGQSADMSKFYKTVTDMLTKVATSSVSRDESIIDENATRKALNQEMLRNLQEKRKRHHQATDAGTSMDEEFLKDCEKQKEPAMLDGNVVGEEKPFFSGKPDNAERDPSSW